jgi:hypothetical protein
VSQLFKFVNPEATLKDFIQVYDKYVSSDVWDLILSEYPDDDPDWNSSRVSKGTEAVNLPDYRNSLNIGISSHEVIAKNKQTREILDEKLFKIVNDVWSDYSQRVVPWVDTRHDDGYQLLCYTEGCFFKQHTDHLYFPEIVQDGYVLLDHTPPRQISFSIQLNDDYEGGDLTFFNDAYKVPKKKGLITVFPSYNLFPHQVTEVTKGRRYSIVTWFS